MLAGRTCANRLPVVCPLSCFRELTIIVIDGDVERAGIRVVPFKGKNCRLDFTNLGDQQAAQPAQATQAGV